MRCFNGSYMINWIFFYGERLQRLEKQSLYQTTPIEQFYIVLEVILIAPTVYKRCKNLIPVTVNWEPRKRAYYKNFKSFIDKVFIWLRNHAKLEYYHVCTSCNFSCQHNGETTRQWQEDKRQCPDLMFKMTFISAKKSSTGDTFII